MSMSATRDVTWDGFLNARDLGGLSTTDGGRTRPGAVIRSGTVAFVTDAGWRAAWQAGVRTVLDLREPAERDPGPAPPGMTRLQVPLDDLADTTYWTRRRLAMAASPLYYRSFLAFKADRCAAVVTALARAPAGGVIVHCSAGRDRTGLVSVLLLALAGVEPEEIVADYLHSEVRLPALWAALGRPDDGPAVRRLLAAHGTDAATELRRLLAGFDVAAYLTAAGVSAQDLAALRSRLRD